MAVNLPEVLDKTTMKPVRVLHPSETMADLSILSVSTADIKILISEGIALGDWVRVYYPNGKSGVFRAGNPAYDYDKDTMTVSMNHGCVTLADNIVTEGYEEDSSGEIEEVYFEGTIREVVNKLLGYQKTKHWKLGTVEPTDEVKIEIKYQDVLTLINDAMEQVDDSYIDYDQQSYPWTINIRKKPTTVTSEGRLSRNVRSAQVSYDDSELITKLYCNELDTPLTSANVSKYGLREGFYYVSSDDSDWVAKACAKYLKNRENPVVSVTIDGADFSQITGVAIDKVVLADLYRLAIPKYSAVVEEQITELTYEDLINRPNECSITLGSHKNDLSSVLAETSSTASSASTTASYVSAREKTHWDNFIGEVDGLNTKITQLKDLIKLEANDVENRLHSELTITASQIQSRLTSGWTGYMSMITQTAEQIRMEVNNRFFGLSSSISQTASNVNIQVRDAKKSLQSQIDVNADNIAMKVNQGDMTASFVIGIINGTTTAQINAARINLNGYVTATQLSSKEINFYKLKSERGGIVCASASVTKLTVGGVNCDNIYKAYKDVSVTQSGGTVTLTFTDFTTGNHNTKSVTFNQAATLKGTWSGGTYTAGPNASGSSTIVATQLHNNPFKLQYWELINTYTVEVGYSQNGTVKSTGGSLSFIATEAYEAGQRSVTPSAPSYGGNWSNGTLYVTANNANVYARTINQAVLPENEDDIQWIGTTKWLSVPLVIKDSLGFDTGYHPLLAIPAGKAYDAGWEGYHNSNKFSMETGATSTVKKVYRPTDDPAATTAEEWFRIQRVNAWETLPGSSNITDTNNFTYRIQRKIGSGAWVDMMVDSAQVTLKQSGDTVYARTGALNIAKLAITHTPTVKDWSIGDAYADKENGLVRTNAAKIRLALSVKVDGKSYSKIVYTDKFSLTSLYGTEEYAGLKHGNKVVAWLKMPERTIPEPTVSGFFANYGYAPSSGLEPLNSSKIRLNVGVSVNGTQHSAIVTTANAFSLGSNYRTGYATLYYGSTPVAWLKLP